jgi:hypothetical protein
MKVPAAGRHHSPTKGSNPFAPTPALSIKQENFGQRNHHQPDCEWKNPGVDRAVGRGVADAAVGITVPLKFDVLAASVR